MRDVPDIDATTPRDYERPGYPFDRRSRRIEREREREEERKGDIEREQIES